MAEKQPNVLFIMADQLTALALGCYGNRDVKTPNLDRLAERGVTFVNNYCNCPICAPSRASMSSGRLAARLQNYDNGTEFPASIPTFMHHPARGGLRGGALGQDALCGARPVARL